MHDVMTRPDRRSAAVPGVRRLASPGRYDEVLRLQSAAGNRAVATLLSARRAPTVQRCGSTPPDACPCHERDDDGPAAAGPVVQRAGAGATGKKSKKKKKKTTTPQGGVPGSTGCIATSSAAEGERVRFKKSSTSFLTSADETRARALAKELGPGERFVLHGYASYEKRPDHMEMNWRLSCARAERVRRVLLEEGVGKDRIDKPEAHGADPAVKSDLVTQRSVVVEKRAGQAPAGKPPGAPASPRVCGPNIDSQLTTVLTDVETYFTGLSFPEKVASCQAITFPVTAGMAWDIIQLFKPHTGWLSDKPFLGKCGIPHGIANIESPTACSNSVRAGSKCNLAGTVNYSLLGMIARLCRFPYSALTRESIPGLVYMWKAIEWIVLDRWDDPVPPVSFALAVFDGGPAARPATENRPTCTGTCTETAVPSFDFRWVPFHI